MAEDKELKLNQNAIESPRERDMLRSERKSEAPLSPEIPSLESEEADLTGAIDEAAEATSAQEAALAAAAAPAGAYDPQMYRKVESILEEDLSDMYNSMDPNDQMKFKVKGEEVANSIVKIIYYESKIKVGRIISLIRSWLALIPGINKYFLEQEAKIKTDRLLELADKSKKIR